MNPLLGLLGAYGVNKATGLGDRMTGLLDNVVNLFKEGAPVEDRNPPGGARTQAASPRPVNTSPMIPTDQSIDMAAPGNAGIAQDMAGFAQQQAKSPTREYIDADTTAPVTSEEVDEVIKTAAKNVQQREADPEYGRYLSSLVSEQGINSPEVQEFNAEKALGSLWDQTLGNEEWRLRKAMVLNSMRLNPDSTLTAAFADRIKSLRKRRGANAMADRLEKVDATKYAALITGLRNGDLEAKDVISTVYKNPTTFQQVQEMLKTPEGVKTLDEMSARGLSPFGQEATGKKEWDKGQVKYVMDAAGEYRAAGQGAVNLQNQLNRFAMQIAQMPEGTGPTQETLAQLTELAAKVGMPVDTSKITDAQSLAAASGMLVAEQLRLNKGPQTDFDARFTATFFPSMGLTTEANQKINDYLTSVNRINIYKASQAGRLLSLNPNEGIAGLTALDDMAYNFPAVMQNSSGQWVTFNSYMNNPKLQGKSEQEKIDAWIEQYKKTRR